MMEILIESMLVKEGCRIRAFGGPQVGVEVDPTVRIRVEFDLNTQDKAKKQTKYIESHMSRLFHKNTHTKASST